MRVLSPRAWRYVAERNRRIAREFISEETLKDLSEKYFDQTLSVAYCGSHFGVRLYTKNDVIVPPYE